MGFAKSITKAQWKWLLDRHLEGYYIRDLADFAGVHPCTLMRYWAHYGMRVTGVHDELPQIQERKEEFLRLGEEVKDG
jgi:hypothetical protein